MAIRSPVLPKAVRKGGILYCSLTDFKIDLNFRGSRQWLLFYFKGSGETFLVPYKILSSVSLPKKLDLLPLSIHSFGLSSVLSLKTTLKV